MLVGARNGKEKVKMSHSRCGTWSKVEGKERQFVGGGNWPNIVRGWK